MTGFMKTRRYFAPNHPVCTLISRFLKALKSHQAMTKREREQQEKEDGRVEEEKGLTLLLVFTLSTL